MNEKMETSRATIYSLLKENTINWQQVLSEILSSFECTTGTVHFLDQESSLLHLEVQQGIPDFLIPKVSVIPIGKGMAGIAAERREPIEMCNLQTDKSGVARPAAKETKVEGSIAVPMMLDGDLFGVLGIAKPVSYDFTEIEVNDLLKIGTEMSRNISSGLV